MMEILKLGIYSYIVLKVSVRNYIQKDTVNLLHIENTLKIGTYWDFYNVIYTTRAITTRSSLETALEY